VLHSSIEKRLSCSYALLATAQILVIADNGKTTKVRTLIDQGSEISLVSERLVQLLHLTRSHSSISLIGVGKKANKTKGLTNFTIRSYFDNSEISISAHILPKLTSSVPSVNVQKNDWPHLEGLTFADPNYSISGPVDIILRADVYPQIIEDGIVRRDAQSPIAQRTKLDWIISGPTNGNISVTHSQGYHISVDKDLHDLFQRFWKLEEITHPPRQHYQKMNKNANSIINQLIRGIKREDT